MEERFEDLEQTKLEQLKSLASKNGDYEDELKKQDVQITELTNQIKLIKETLEEKDSFENQQAWIIKIRPKNCTA